ncbi:MAG: hypothetical protein ABSF64_23590 [Bryobacteraceae bacterium]|jgi:hypothetical protein
MKKTNEPRTLTEARIHANRENAKKSTGPRTPAGKAASSRNRLRHGLRANKHILLADDDPEEFLLLLNDLDGRFQPVGDGEERLVLRLAADQWRLDRALPMEAGIYRRRLESVAEMDYSRKKGLRNQKTNHELRPESIAPPPPPPHPDDRLTRAFTLDCEVSHTFANLARYKSGIEISIDRGLRQLKTYQAARLANARQAAPAAAPVESAADAEPPSPPDPSPAMPAEPAPMPPKSMEYHSNPTNESAARLAVPAMLLAVLALLLALPRLLPALAALPPAPRTGHPRREVISFTSRLADNRVDCARLTEPRPARLTEPRPSGSGSHPSPSPTPSPTRTHPELRSPAPAVLK